MKLSLYKLRWTILSRENIKYYLVYGKFLLIVLVCLYLYTEEPSLNSLLKDCLSKEPPTHAQFRVKKTNCLKLWQVKGFIETTT